MSDANRVKIGYVQESTFGAKKTGSNLQLLRYNSESLKQDMATTISEEIRSDRQISDVARIGLSASGGINFELSYGSHDDFFKAALFDDSGWSTEIGLKESYSLSINGDDDSISDSESRLARFTANQWILVSGFATAANNGFFKIASVVAGKLVLLNGTALVTESAGECVSIQQGSQIINGMTLVSYNLERTYEDLTSVLSLLKGMTINSLSLEVPADGIITGSFEFLGSAEEPLAASAGTGYNGETKSVIMTGANHVTDFLENLGDLAILSLSMNLSNNLRTRLQVGNLGVASMGSGTVEITGTVTLHLTDATLFAKYLNQTVTSITIAVQDTDGNGYVIEMPSVKIINGTRNAGGINTDVVGTFEFRAYMDASEEITIRIARFPVTLARFAGSIAATSSVTGALTVTPA